MQTLAQLQRRRQPGWRAERPAMGREDLGRLPEPERPAQGWRDWWLRDDVDLAAFMALR
jgi:hypothetical protein